MIDPAFRQFIQDAIASNLELTLNIVLGGKHWSGQVTDSKTWLKFVRGQGLPTTILPNDLELDAFHLKDCLLLDGGIHGCGGGVIRFRLDAVQAWWIESVREDDKMAP